MAKISVEQSLLRASTHLRKGEIASARRLYEEVLLAFPKNARAQQGLDKLTATKSQDVESNDPPRDELHALIASYQQGRYDDLIEKAQRLIKMYPSSFVVWNILAAGRQALGQVAEAEQGFRKAIEINPSYAEAYNNLGNTLKQQGRFNEAISAYRQALVIKPAYAEAYNNKGNALKEQGKLDEALTAYLCAIEINPAYAEAYNHIGNALLEQGKLDEALSAYRHSLRIKPAYAEAHYNLGKALQECGKLDEAISAYRHALGIKPAYAEAYNNLGVALNERGEFGDAISAYRLALGIRPSYAESYNNMGNALKDIGKVDEAIAAYQRAIDINPSYAEAYYNKGNALKESNRLDEAISAYQRTLEIKPAHAAAEAQLLYQRCHVCDFNVAPLLNSASARLGISTEAVSPFAALSWADHSEQQLSRSKKWADEKYKGPASPLPEGKRVRPELLKIGYFSADFHNHATLYLMSGLLREHDKNQFEVFAYSYGRSKAGELRRQAESDADHFFDVTDLSDRGIADLARSHGLHIAIDLKGYTQHTRSGIFQYRIAPVQINYLGYPGSMGASFIDYIIADSIVIPKDQRAFYSEKVIYLSDTYQPNDQARAIATTNTTRAEFGLPSDALVFCCFNNSYKIGLSEFSIWLRLLRKVERSVLWLLKSNRWAESNLREEAKKRGIDPSRLIFAEKLPHAEHLARHKHADLFLDTFNYNAHTTASDALWGGLPVVTKQGKQFAARVASSLLTAVGLPELITETEADYEDLILALASHPERLAAVKAKLAKNRMTTPLFDTKRYAKNFEIGMRRAYDLYLDGKEPEDIWTAEPD